MTDTPRSPLEGRKAVVTGAGSGIGRAISLALARRGMLVSLLGRDAGKLQAVARLAPPGHCEVCSIDMSEPTSIDAFSLMWLARNDELRVLVHCAGTYARSSVAETSVDQLDEVFATNVRGPFLLTSTMIPALRSAQGDIVFLNSSAAVHHRADLAAYSMSKAALRALANSLREEVNRDKIRVLSILAGRTATPMLQKIMAEEAATYEAADYLRPEDVADAVIAALTLGQSAELTEIHVRPAQPPRARSRPAPKPRDTP